MPRGNNSQPTQIDEAVSAVIRAQMSYKKMNQADLARATNISQPTISRITNGERVIDLPQLRDIAAALGVSWMGILTQAQEVTSDSIASVTPLPAKKSEDAPTVTELQAARRNKGKLINDPGDNT